VPLRVVPASSQTEELARRAGIELLDLDEAARSTWRSNGADELDGDLNLIKGGGGALLREKLVVAAARRFVVVAETDKLVDRIGEGWRVPVEVVRFGWRTTLARLLDGVVAVADVRCLDDGTPLSPTRAT